jgi:hypothetical protein
MTYGLGIWELYFTILGIQSRNTQVGQTMIMSKGYMVWYYTTNGTLLDGTTNLPWLS